MRATEPLFDELTDLPEGDYDDGAAFAKGLALNNSFKFIKTLWSETNCVHALVKQLCEEIKQHTQPVRFKKQNYINNLVPLLANLVRAYSLDNMWVAYSRSPRGYKASKRYNPCGVTQLLMNEVVPVLIKLKYIEQHLGYQNAHKSRLSRIQATGKFIELWNKHDVTYGHFINHSKEETIILKSEKDSKGQATTVEYDDTEQTVLLRANLQRINQSLEHAVIKLKLPKGGLETVHDEMTGEAKEEDQAPTPDFSRTKLRRIFNNESFDCGGRFYHGWWMEIPSEYREYITINGIPTIEIDYSAIHPRLLYSEVGVQAPSDPYSIEGYSTDYRNAIKKALLIIINAKNPKKSLGSLMGELPKLHKELKTKKAILKLLEAIEATHKPIARYFHSNIGVALQRIDSQVAEQVMLRLLEGTETFPIVALPVHDSFIVPDFARELATRFMEEEFQKVTKQVGIVEAKLDSTTERIREAVWSETVPIEEGMLIGSNDSEGSEWV